MIYSWTVSDPVPVVHKKRYVTKPPSFRLPTKPRKPAKKSRPSRQNLTGPKYPQRNSKNHYVYVLHTRNSSGLPVFYTGYTIDLGNRLRQHNKQKSGGAKYTSRFSGWEYLCFISGFRGTIGKTTALQCEYKLKKQSGIERTAKFSKTHPIEKRVARIAAHLHKETFTSKSVQIASLNITINWLNMKAWKRASRLQWPPNVSHKLCAA